MLDVIIEARTKKESETILYKAESLAFIKLMLVELPFGSVGPSKSSFWIEDSFPPLN